ncbi:MAG: M20 family metallopeptidase [Mariniblastus sp.]|nr:M20 family metallopeptidase [Mariniblastus sp.]
MNVAVNKGVRLLEILRRRQSEMMELLTSMVKAESPSHDFESQIPVQEMISESLTDCDFEVKKFQANDAGGQLLALPKKRVKGQPVQMMLGHCDTVWPIGTLEKMPIHLTDGKLHGPGVYDMKAGLVQAIFAVKAIRELGETPSVTPYFFINSDEEIGSAKSKQNIFRLAKASDRVFVMEPGLGPTGKLKTARKGVGRFTVKVIGKASHAGLAPEQGVSAILELSHVVQALFALNNPEKGITVNVGTIDGGMRPNVVAPEASAVVDVRVVTHEDAREIEQAIEGLRPVVPGTRLEITGRVGRPPMEKTPGNQRIWEHAQEAADEMEISIEDGLAGGGSDGNFTSLHCPTLDGMGAVGDGAHALTEFVFVDKMPERAALLARLLLLPELRPGL